MFFSVGLILYLNVLEFFFASVQTQSTYTVFQKSDGIFILNSSIENELIFKNL